MLQFLETICIRNGIPQHLDWHQRRMDATLGHFYPVHHHSWILEKCVQVPESFRMGQVRCRVVYDAHKLDIHFYPYEMRIVQKLKLIEVPDGYDYRFKYADRITIEELYSQRGEADDILMLRNGWVMDTSIANIAFLKYGRWYTPSMPLLAGTTRKRLLFEGKINPQAIHQNELGTFEAYKLLNAMLHFEESPLHSINLG